ncbi:uncharacterized protein VTP21DRAFT_8082 [Calcarisporiella thermophila]|uniref:uncharacterized protein n=1 Tax=Calcarisporiella thermophila TaxID=911321 RepID=UPI0037433C7C
MSTDNPPRKRTRTEENDQENNGQSSNTRELERLEPSIFNLQPLDETVRAVGDFLYGYVDRPNVEIEAKLGVLIDKRTNERIQLPVMVETILSKDDRWLRFESNMSLDQHRNFNQILNKRVLETQSSEYRGAKVQYKHTRERDRYFEQNGKKVRVTTDQKSGELVAVVEKVRLANLNVYSPGTQLDFRISVNLEIPREVPHGNCTYERNKDRLSYRHQIWQFDLTQVKIGEQRANSSVPPELMHELEVEFADPGVLLRERKRLDAKEPNEFLEIVRVFLNNIRMLAKYAL